MLFGIALQYVESNALEGDPAMETRLLEYTTSMLMAYALLGTTENDILGDASVYSLGTSI